ncbi:MAG: mannose-1-phosphate guanylyltransferase [Candidatus Omnitrophica bacterium]|nr:mannose-1-phosphate guanylyltransferase [Candidatus Omnitrophota bacterium]
MNSNVYAVILAGGSGTRFWPKSRASKPKQFLDVTGQGTFLDMTIRRILPLVPKANIWVVTNSKHKGLVADSLRKNGVPSGQILVEPCGKNTAPAIGWAAEVINRQNPDAVMCVLPSDHLMTNEENFLVSAAHSVSLAEQNFLVAMGVKPTRPETGYGYLKVKPVKLPAGIMLKVEKFIEKPDMKIAEQFVRQENYLWNGGMFSWKTSVILAEFKKYQPAMFKILKDLKSAAKASTWWNKMTAISIDYAILEKSDCVAAVESSGMGWSDLGSWQALSEVLPADDKGNIFNGEVVSVDAKNSFVWADKRLIALVGLDNVVVVDTPDALLICDKSQSQKVKAVVEQLKQNKKYQKLV